MYSKIQYISQGTSAAAQLDNVHQALDSGCTWIQLRFKNAEEKELADLAHRVKKDCADYDATFILNDQVQLAKEVEADGVHLGLTDMSIIQARELMGEEKIIGGTANTLSDVLQRVNEGCDYIGLGPLRFTTTKEHLSPVLGIAGYQSILNELKKEEIKIPVYAIGGIAPEDVPHLISCGVYGIAVSGIITHHENKKKLIKHLKFSLYAPTEYSQYEI